MTKVTKVAVIGAGVAGLSAAWLLGKRFDVTLFEADARLGGHANTVDVDAPEGRCPIDTGFIVYNTAGYPNLVGLFDHLGVPAADTDMGFAVSLGGGGYEYSGNGLAGLIGQPRNLMTPGHWQLMRDLFRFFREASRPEATRVDPAITLGQWLAERRYSKRFIHAHIVPMGAAIWSTPAEEMLAFPFAAFARFFANHGLLQTFNRPPWRTVRGGSREYVSRIMAAFAGRAITGDPVVAVKGGASDGVTVTTRKGGTAHFNAALLCCHADDAERLVTSLEDGSRGLLSKFRYTQNTAVLHTDSNQMPRRRALWSSWNYIGDAAERDGGISSERISVTYWMNRLQPLATKTNYFVTLNPVRPIARHHIVQTFDYTHPMFDAEALAAQAKLPALQGRNALWFAGSYFGYGFHEDGVQAGLAAAEHLSSMFNNPVVRPWTWDTRQSRVPVAELCKVRIAEAVS
jgi:predicted NAD/FAD-binding protein